MDYRYKIMLTLTLYSLYIGFLAFCFACRYVRKIKEFGTFKYDFLAELFWFLALLPISICFWSDTLVEFLQLN